MASLEIHTFIDEDTRTEVGADAAATVAKQALLLHQTIGGGATSLAVDFQPTEYLPGHLQKSNPYLRLSSLGDDVGIHFRYPTDRVCIDEVNMKARSGYMDEEGFEYRLGYRIDFLQRGMYFGVDNHGVHAGSPVDRLTGSAALNALARSLVSLRQGESNAWFQTKWTVDGNVVPHASFSRQRRGVKNLRSSV